jgi:hypothetical protein
MMLIGMVVFSGNETRCFGYGGLGYGAARDYGNLWLADRLGAFTPPADPFANRRMPQVQSPPVSYGRAPVTVTPAAPRITARDLMSPSMGGLANLGRTMTTSQLQQPALPAARPPIQQRSYGLPSDMGLHSVSPGAFGP